jgi:hypothetical protein
MRRWLEAEQDSNAGARYEASWWGAPGLVSVGPTRLVGQFAESVCVR